MECCFHYLVCIFFPGEKVEETKTENEAEVSTSKPNENQLSLSMCVNTDDVQDDLDEDLKEMEQVYSQLRISHSKLVWLQSLLAVMLLSEDLKELSVISVQTVNGCSC
jgi:hypothetical protein